MPEPACLHIQGSPADPVRVVDLTAGSARIGGAAYCDVRLREPGLTDEACRLRRRGEAWHLFPAGADVPVWLGEERVDRPRPLEFGETFRVGEHWLTLRPSGSAARLWGHSTPIGSEPVAPREGDDDRLPPTAEGASEWGSRHRAEWRPRPEPQDRFVRSSEEAKRWETRWKAVGEKLRGVATAPAPEPTSARPVRREPVDRPSRTGHSREPVSRVTDRPVTRPTSHAPPPVVRPTPPPLMPTVVRRAEPVPMPTLARVATFIPVARTVTSPSAEPVPEFDPTPTEAEPIVVPEIVGESAPGLDPTPSPVLAGWSPPTETIDQGSHESDPAVTTGSVACEDVALILPEISEPAEEETEPASPRTLGATRRAPRAESVPTPDDVIESDDALSPFPPRMRLEPEPPAPASRPEEPIAETTFGRSFIADVEPTVAPSTDAGPPPRPEPVREREPLTRDQGRARARLGPADPSAAWSAAGRETAGESPAGNQPRNRALDAPSESPPRTRPSGRPDDRWPTVADILGARPIPPRSSATGPSAKPTASLPTRPLPTVVREPSQWGVSPWLATVPMVMLVLGLGGLGLLASLSWSRDAYNTGVVAARLTLAEPGSKPLPKGVEPGNPAWWTSNAGRLVQWSAYLDRASADPQGVEEARALLDRADEASPLHPVVRHARARGTTGGPTATPPPLAVVLAPSRDVASLTWAGRQLLAAGKKDAALRAYQAALEMAATSEPARDTPPPFLDDPQIRRYALPSEELIGSVLREMAERTEWTYQDWSDVVPTQPVAALALARVLKARHGAEADAALDLVLARTEPGPTPPRAGHAAALRLAVRAEAMAMKARWPEADESYRAAIALQTDEVARRSWWMNVADLALRVNDEPNRLKALELAKSDDPKDEITQRAVELQKASGVVKRQSIAQARDPEARRARTTP